MVFEETSDVNDLDSSNERLNPNQDLMRFLSEFIPESVRDTLIGMVDIQMIESRSNN